MTTRKQKQYENQRWNAYQAYRSSRKTADTDVQRLTYVAISMVVLTIVTCIIQGL